MVAEVNSSTDKGLGIAIITGVAIVAGALAMLLAPGEVIGAAGFAVAVGAGLALVIIVQLSND